MGLHRGPPALQDVKEFTPAQLDIVRDYYTHIAGIPDCFGLTGGELSRQPHGQDLTRLVGISPYLHRWWEALDHLDAGLRDGQGHLDPFGQIVLRHELGSCFQARQDTLRAIAHHAGARVPSPEHSDGSVTTSHSGSGAGGERGPVGRE